MAPRIANTGSPFSPRSIPWVWRSKALPSHGDTSHRVEFGGTPATEIAYHLFDMKGGSRVREARIPREEETRHVGTKEQANKSAAVEAASPRLPRVRIPFLGSTPGTVGPVVWRRSIAGSGTASRACGKDSPESGLGFNFL